MGPLHSDGSWSVDAGEKGQEGKPPQLASACATGEKGETETRANFKGRRERLNLSRFHFITNARELSIHRKGWRDSMLGQSEVEKQRSSDYASGATTAWMTHVVVVFLQMLSIL